jgi:hypothetical protein
MCRSIKVLRHADTPASEQEIQEAALQFVRKISGYRTPSQKNAQSFDAAVEEVSRSSQRLLDSLRLNQAAPATSRNQKPGASRQKNERGNGVEDDRQRSRRARMATARS